MPPALTADRPDVLAGDRWRFLARDRLASTQAEETRRIVHATAERIFCEIDSTAPDFPRGLFVYTREWNLLARPALSFTGDLPEDVGQWRWQPAYPHFRFPLVPGQRWQGRATVANTLTGTRNVHSYTASVLAAQRVTVPAGTVDTLPVRYESRVASDDGEMRLAWRNVETLYYAPAVNLFARAEHAITGPDGQPARDSELVLLEYRRG